MKYYFATKDWDQKNVFEKEIIYCFYFTVAPIFSINPFPILTPNKVLKKAYEIEKEAVFDQKANSKQADQNIILLLQT